jgi:hypothetical protein
MPGITSSFRGHRQMTGSTTWKEKRVFYFIAT